MTRPGRHVALLVEDDVEMAAEVGELLDSMGHDHVHAATRDDAEELVEAGQFCYALLDLEIKASADSIKPRVEAGESVRNLLRERYPRRNDADEHRLQILMVSGHSDNQHVVRAFQDRVNDFIPKPIDGSFKERIENALRRSGREKHEHCAEIMRKARAQASNEPAARARLAISGQRVAQRYEVKVNDEQALLTLGSFTLLLRLVAGRLSEREGWVHKTELGARDDQGWKGVSRLKQELSTTPFEIENDGRGAYRLGMSVDVERVETAYLEALDEAAVAKIATKIRQAQRK